MFNFDDDFDVAEIGALGGLLEELSEEKKFNQALAPNPEDNEDEEPVIEPEFISIHRVNQLLTKKKKKLRPFEQYVDDVCSGKKKIGDDM